MAARPRPARFELLVAARYLKAKRKQTVISVITLLSVLGVAAGVMALVIALAINNGFRSTLERNLLGATAHVTVLEKEPGYGLANWRELVAQLRRLPHVVSAAPSLYGSVFLSSPLQSDGCVLKGIQAGSHQASDLARYLKEGALDRLEQDGRLPGIILGSRLAARTGLPLNSVATVISPQGELTPFGPKPSYFRFRVVGIFETGFYDLDSAWAFTSVRNAQKVLSLGDVVNAIELKIDDLDRAPEVARQAERLIGPRLAATHWIEQNRQIFNALRMERTVAIITIGLIELVAAMNILVALVMMVMEKYRDIAVLMSMGARREQIRRIFVYQGLIIGTVGVALGLAAGYTLSYLADRYRWVRLDEEVYSLSFVPFEPRWGDGVWIAAAALLVSFLATIYPASHAAKIAPAEALRYE
ncbi:MAG: FtsX-like permease family protein [Bryobacterales bacterium]|nr:ABC transporter permease [Bryobacteraceae bacterium]MDW8355879.1 FtsX-like permease family protein [Bryobacterales bacterium]